jgi:hypothetical protein
MGDRTFSRNVPASAAIAEFMDAPVLPEPVPWTYYDTAASAFYCGWDYADARKDDNFDVIKRWEAFEADHDAYFWSTVADNAGIRWEMVDGMAWTHSQKVYDREYWDD